VTAVQGFVRHRTVTFHRMSDPANVADFASIAVARRVPSHFWMAADTRGHKGAKVMRCHRKSIGRLAGAGTVAHACSLNRLVGASRQI
jgi:hypothetical protein